MTTGACSSKTTSASRAFRAGPTATRSLTDADGMVHGPLQRDPKSRERNRERPKRPVLEARESHRGYPRIVHVSVATVRIVSALPEPFAEGATGQRGGQTGRQSITSRPWSRLASPSGCWLESTVARAALPRPTLRSRPPRTAAVSAPRREQVASQEGIGGRRKRAWWRSMGAAGAARG